METYELLDTGAFEKLISSQNQLKQRYQEIQTRYNRIVQDLISNWKGCGADAFESDTERIITNITGLQDILITMCDTLQDCRSIFAQCDTSLGSSNKNSG